MRPDPLYARYPFLRAARAAVQEADISPPRLVTEGDPAVDRARERVERALMSGTVASETPERWSDRDELLSYPIARILVSLVDVRAAVEKYADAEAATAFERLRADLDTEEGTLRSVSTPRADLSTFLDEFDLGPAVRRVARDHGPDGFRVAVSAYLRLVDPDWGRTGGWSTVTSAAARCRSRARNFTDCSVRPSGVGSPRDFPSRCGEFRRRRPRGGPRRGRDRTP
ncbi:hypothetical protein ACFQL0_02270 [Haloplanus litoreus]|uniref:hypothetical protein n=1 Tax=Haloplanus litoreus TaxID=767515 RepID=UPI0036156FFA